MPNYHHSCGAVVAQMGKALGFRLEAATVGRLSKALNQLCSRGAVT